MSDLKWIRGASYLTAFGRTIAVSNKVYQIMTEVPINHVVLSTNADGSDGVPYKPQGFPKGIWNVRDPEQRISPYTAPWIIPTDAWQFVEEWELDEHGLYKCPTGRTVQDWGYALHHSVIDYTFGCLRVIDVQELIWLKNEVFHALAGGEVSIEVEEA